MNQGSSSQAGESDSQNSPPIQFPTNFSQYFTPNYLQNFHPFGPPSNYQPYGHPPPIFQGARPHGNWMQSIPAGFQGGQDNSVHSPNQVFGFATSRSLFGMQSGTSGGAVGNSSSHGSESASPCPASQKQQETVNAQELSDSSDGPRRGTRVNWTEDDNIRLMSSWLSNSVDSIKGNDKKAEHYWKAVAQEFNSNMPGGGHKRTAKQCRTHWMVLRERLQSSVSSILKLEVPSLVGTLMI